MTKKISILSLSIAGLAVLGAVAGATPALAAIVATGDDTYPATWEQIVQLGSPSKISISTDTPDPTPAIIPAVAGTAGGFGTVATQLSVATNDTRGTSLTLQIADKDTANNDGDITTLFHDKTIQTAGDVVFAVNNGGSATTLGANTWGYTFVSGASNSVPTNSSTFTGVPKNGSPNTLLPDNNSNATQSGYVNFGAVVDYSLKAGFTFENVVVYTAAIMP
jgi:hypothetical protein